MSKNKIIKLSIINLAVLVFPLISPLLPKALATTLQPTAQVSFTFDDGFASSRTLAADALAASGYSGTNYIITDCVGMATIPNACKADGGRAYMTWSQIAELNSIYGWEIGSHTQTHPLLASTDPTDQPNKLTQAQVIAELVNAKTALNSHGYPATDFATPYGDYEPDGHPVLANIAKYYASHRGFADTGYNTFPYNDYLLLDQEVLNTTTVATIKNYINKAKTNNQWLILTFHEIVSSGAPNGNDTYSYNVDDLAQIAAYVKAQGIRVVNVNEGLSTNAGNMFQDGSFNAAISSNTTDTTVWSTDDSTRVKQDTANNGNYPDFTNSVSFSANNSTSLHLFSPRVPISSSKKYIFKQFVNIVNSAGEIAFYIDEYDANGGYVGSTAQYKGSVMASTDPRVRSFNFEYTPSLAAASARLQIVATASTTQAYVDNIQWFAEDGSTTSAPTPIGGGSSSEKTGDVNGDNSVNALDLSIMLSNWSNSSASRGQGDLSGDGTVNALDLSILLSNWGL